MGTVSGPIPWVKNVLNLSLGECKGAIVGAYKDKELVVDVLKGC